ncbi:hypothetical protein ACWEOG_22380 [Amycolatopsis japonica]
MNTQRLIVTLALFVLCALAFLSGLYPVVNLIMTIVVIAAFVIGAVITTVHLTRLNSPKDVKPAPVPPEGADR